jgi:hypothetical protein
VALEPEPAGGGPAGAEALFQQRYAAVVEGDTPAVAWLLVAGAIGGRVV